MFVSFFIFGLTFTLNAQSINDYPKIGKSIPDFVLHNVNGIKTDSITSIDIKGKYTILDFWNDNCSACIEGFPKIDSLSKLFRDEVQIILISPGNIESIKLYAFLKKKLNLD